MRIAVIGARGGAPAQQGIHRALLEVCPRLVRRGHDIDVFTETNGHAVAPIEGTRLVRVPNLGFGVSDASAHAVLSSLLGAVRGYDVINFCAAQADGLFTLAAKLGLHRTVVSVHALEHDRPRRSPLLSPEMAAARFADAITVVSRRLERHFRERYGREAFYIPNGVSASTTLPDPAPARRLGLTPGRYVLLADRMVPASGFHLALAAAEDLPAGLHLVVAETGEGDPDYRARLSAQADPRRVVLAGPLPPAHRDALMAHAYLFLLPSQTDEPPQSLMVALARGRATMVSDLREHLDIVGADAFTFTSGEPADLRRVLVWLANDPGVVREMERRTAAAVVSRYGWDRIAEAYELVFSSVL